ncbi:hypothetical protein ANO14919_104730 [Xylariales sp. No.14919]|nr:hypothetical protein ANO14919_104730 [Xylariales sp. No.14919]
MQVKVALVLSLAAGAIASPIMIPVRCLIHSVPHEGILKLLNLASL